MPPLSPPPPPLPLRHRPSPPLLIAAALILFTSLFSSAHTAHPPSCGFSPAAADHHHYHHPPSCAHDHHHVHLRSLLAEEEGLELDGFDLHDHHHFHDGGSDLKFSTIGLWARAMGCSLLVSMASPICLAILPLIFVQGKPSKVIVDSLVLFGVGDFGILVRSGLTIFKAQAFNFLSALAALAGTALALVLGKQPGQSSLIEGFTAAGFIYIAVAGVLPEMNSEKTTFRGTMIQLTSLSLRMAIALGISLVE